MIGELHTLVLRGRSRRPPRSSPAKPAVAAMHRYTQLSLANLYLAARQPSGWRPRASLALGSHALRRLCA